MIDDVKPVVSERKKAANRANAQKSTGPKTAEGKARSRLNALTHGLCAVVIEIPGEDRELLEKRVREWADDADHEPGSLDMYLIRRAAMHSIRLDRMECVHDAKIAKLVRDADATRRSEKLSEVETLHRQLFTDAAADIAQRKLCESVEGIDHMLTLWASLRPSLEPVPEWDADDGLLALRLMGHPSAGPERIPSPLTTETMAIIEHRNIALKLKENEMPDRLTWERRYSNQASRIYDQGRVGGLAEQAEIGRQKLIELHDREVDALLGIRAQLADADALDRAQTPWRARFDASDEGRLLRRYEQESENSFIKLLREAGRPIPRPKSARTASRNEPTATARPDPYPEKNPSTPLDATAVIRPNHRR